MTNKKFAIWSYSISGCYEWFKYGFKFGDALKTDDDPELLGAFDTLDEAFSKLDNDDEFANEIHNNGDGTLVIRETYVNGMVRCKRTKTTSGDPELGKVMIFDTFAEAKMQYVSNGTAFYILRELRRAGCPELLINDVYEALDDNSNVWYEIMYSNDDEDWGDGTDDLEEAVERVRRMHTEDFPDAYIAITLDRDGNGNPEQIGEFKQF